MKASSPLIANLCVAFIIFSFLFFDVHRLNSVSVVHVLSRSNRFAGGRLFNVNNTPCFVPVENMQTFT